MDNLIAGMTWVDWIIVIAIAGAVLSGLSQGFLRSPSSLLGLLPGPCAGLLELHLGGCSLQALRKGR